MRARHQWLADLLQAADKILSRTGAGRSAFDNDEMIRVWVLFHLILVGESARQLLLHPMASGTERFLRNAVGRRNLIVHQIFNTDFDLIWSAVQEEIPILRDWAQAQLAATP